MWDHVDLIVSLSLYKYIVITQLNTDRFDSPAGLMFVTIPSQRCATKSYFQEGVDD